MPYRSSGSDSDSSSTSGMDLYEPLKRLAAHHVPLRNPNKPLTPFFIADILGGGGRRTERREPERPNHAHAALTIVRPWACSPGSSQEENDDDEDDDDDEDIDVDIEVEDETPPKSNKPSPLDALFQMTSNTFNGMDAQSGALDDAARKDQLSLFTKSQPPKKRRKSRTAFTNHQIYELEKRFLYQKYLTPADRDEIASSLGLSNAQVITWFQNRRAKLKRDLEELKADVSAARDLDSPEARAVFGPGGPSPSATATTPPEDVLRKSMITKHGLKTPPGKVKTPEGSPVSS